ncbi:RidA family protein [Streptomyces sp. SID3343]|uniref:RidA family protein n=1 Tax=Streptomyces sp. SID3343 TaxID=2690260 RepID=UPI00136A2AA6|nr:RidA family protein [Streptomyces sp. SID3343]MYW03949.1 RidA family protein [Streptomyces sp. SID3343]
MTGSHNTGGIERYSSGGRWEETFGYSRAVAAGDYVHVSGCTAIVEGNLAHEGDPRHQTLAALGIAIDALAHFGLTTADVVRTRMFITHARDSDDVGSAHAEVFGDSPPAATMVVVAGLIDSRMLVEVEVDAYRGRTHS